MSLPEVKKILLKVNTDSAFRNNFFSKQSEILEHYELTGEEKQCLSELKSENQITNALDEIQYPDEFFISDIRI